MPCLLKRCKMLYLTYHLYLYLTVYIKSRNVHGWVEDPWNFAWIRTRVLFLYDSGSGCYTSSTWSSLLICQKLGNLEKQQIFVKINHFSLFYSNWTKSWQEISVYFLFNHKKIYYKKKFGLIQDPCFIYESGSMKNQQIRK